MAGWKGDGVVGDGGVGGDVGALVVDGLTPASPLGLAEEGLDQAGDAEGRE